MIFAHGWIPEYEMGVPDFPNATSWQNNGYNTFIFRFINKASDPGDGAICNAGGALFPIMGVAEFNCPKDAEPRVWETNGTGEDLVNGFKSFFNQYPNYNKEIRMVGHSLGTQVVTYASYRLHEQNYSGPKPGRIELIDPLLAPRSRIQVFCRSLDYLFLQL